MGCFNITIRLQKGRGGGTVTTVYKKKQTEEKAKVVAAVWRTELIQFHAALQI